MKKINTIIPIACITVITVLLLVASVPMFSAEEAATAVGVTYNFSEGWTITYEDGTSEEITLPFSVPVNKGDTMFISNTLDDSYAGLALSMNMRNAAMVVQVDDRPLFFSGYMNEEMNGKNLNGRGESGDAAGVSPLSRDERRNEDAMLPGREGESGDAWHMGGSRGDRSDLSESGEILVDLPNSLSNSTIIISLDRVAHGRVIVLEEIRVGERDAAITSVLGSQMLPLFFCLVILISAVGIFTMGILSSFGGRESQGLFRLFLLFLDILVFTFVKTEILITFFSNVTFFYTLEQACFIMMPVLLMYAFKDTLLEVCPRVSVAFFAINVVAACTLHTINFMNIFRLGDLQLVSMGCLFATAVLLILAISQRQIRLRRRWHLWTQSLGVASLVAGNAISILRRYYFQGSYWTGAAIAFLMMVFCIATTIDSIVAMSESHTARLKAYATRLEEQNESLVKAKEDADEARKEAEIANRAKGDFLANMSHEIRTPINAVLGMDEMILRESGEKHIRGYAADILSSGKTLLSLINDILDFSKIDSGKMEIVPVEYDLSSVINDLVNMILPRAKAKGLKLNVDVREDIPSKYFGDDVRIRQVITNILTNAVKYTHEGDVSMRISGHPNVDEKGYYDLHVEVADTGIGIKQEDIPKLFTPYERIEEQRNRNIEGTGLGMNITTQLLYMMDSRLEVDSVYGEGSTFYFDITQKVMDQTPMGRFSDRISHMEENYEYHVRFAAPGADILVVDDNVVNLKVIKGLLKATRVNTDTASSGFEAIEKAKEKHYHIIFMDHMMPKMDGIEAMHRIRKLEDSPNKDTPIYILTANAVAGAKEMYLEEGFDGFLSKPVVSEKLEEAIVTNLPESLLVPVDEDEDDHVEAYEKSRKTEGIPPKDIPAVEGLDWNYAYLHLMEDEIVRQTLVDFYESVELSADRLDDFHNEGNMEDYRIAVHAMKSVAATIGIVPLAGMAKILEYAAADGDTDRIERLHDVFVEEWRSYKDKLKGIFGMGEREAKEKIPFDRDEVIVLLEKIRVAMEDFETDAADEAAKELLKYDYTDEIMESISGLCAAVSDLDGDLCEEIIKELMEGKM